MILRTKLKKALPQLATVKCTDHEDNSCPCISNGVQSKYMKNMKFSSKQ